MRAPEEEVWNSEGYADFPILFFSFLDLPDSIPSVYKLESSKASISACLITDYYPDNIIITDRDGLNKSFQSSIVEVKDPGSNTKEASYGAVYWSQYDFQDDIKYGLNYKTRCRESAEGKWKL